MVIGWAAFGGMAHARLAIAQPCPHDASMSESAEPSPHDPAAPRRKRRKRYAGTHPRRFDQRYKELNAAAYPGILEHVRAQGRTPAGTHVPVLVAEVLAALRPAPGETGVDATLGFGGHARELLARTALNGRLIALDLDAVQLERTRGALATFGARLSAHHGNFAGLPGVLAREGMDRVDFLLADLGASSMQLDDPERGFSFRHDGPLDMRLNPSARRTAADWLAAISEPQLSDCLRDYADEPDHAAIAAAIVARRRERPVTRTLELADLVAGVKRRSRGLPTRTGGPSGPHPATRTFQAIRIIVNDELSSLRELLRVAPACLRPAGRVAIISFHSGEDRLVKAAFREGLRLGHYAAVSDDVIRPGPSEQRDNPRSASARLRWAIRSA